jgi:hypothetical protein
MPPVYNKREERKRKKSKAIARGEIKCLKEVKDNRRNEMK